MRVFLAHPKAWDDELINEAVQELVADMGRQLGDVVVVPGRDDFQANIALEGTFDGWCRSITRRTDQYGRRIYDLVAVPKGSGVGKATAQIVEDALRAGLPVVQIEWLDDGGVEALPVTAIYAEDGENFVSGWDLRTATIN